MSGANAHFEFLLRQGDNALVLGHRLSEWCGVGPALEEDIALANTALDLIGQTRLWLAYAGEVEGAGRSEDDLAYRRDVHDFRNALLLEVPNEDYARTMLREFFFDAFQLPWLTALIESADERVAEIAAKSAKEAAYHLERSAETVIALGDGTDESHQRMETALGYLWPYAGELMVDDEIDMEMAEKRIAPLPSSIRPAWDGTLAATFRDAVLTVPESDFAHKGGRNGFRHTEHLGHMLAQMQVLQRSYPAATW
ncbi:MAG: 1,2-phenylacetyl-CoA epoxidase subunit PaaC [Pseudomonadota bacterium]